MRLIVTVDNRLANTEVIGRKLTTRLHPLITYPMRRFLEHAHVCVSVAVDAMTHCWGVSNLHEDS